MRGSAVYLYLSELCSLSGGNGAGPIYDMVGCRIMWVRRGLTDKRFI